MTEVQLYDEAFAQMGRAPLELDEAQPTDKRRYNRGTRGNRGGGRKHARRTLLIDGVVQDGHYTVVSINRNTIVLESADRTG